jgi:hypothetical protein
LGVDVEVGEGGHGGLAKGCKVQDAVHSLTLLIVHKNFLNYNLLYIIAYGNIQGKTGRCYSNLPR